MPVAMTEAVGPSARHGGAGGHGHGVIARLLASLFAQGGGGGGGKGEDGVEELRAAVATFGLVPTDLNWLSATFANATSTRPDDALFAAPARCRASFPAGSQLR